MGLVRFISKTVRCIKVTGAVMRRRVRALRLGLMGRNIVVSMLKASVKGRVRIRGLMGVCI